MRICSWVFVCVCACVQLPAAINHDCVTVAARRLPFSCFFLLFFVFMLLIVVVVVELGKACENCSQCRDATTVFPALLSKVFPHTHTCIHTYRRLISCYCLLFFSLCPQVAHFRLYHVSPHTHTQSCT